MASTAFQIASSKVGIRSPDVEIFPYGKAMLYPRQ